MGEDNKNSSELINEIFLQNYSKLFFIPNNELKEFESYELFKEFIKKELSIWEKFNAIPCIQRNANNYRSTQALCNMLNEQTNQQNINGLFNQMKNTTNKLFNSDSEFGQFIIRLADKNPSQAEAAYSTIIGNELQLAYVNDQQYFLGLLEGLFYLKKDEIKLDNYSSLRLDKFAAEHSQAIEKISNDYSTLENKYTLEIEKQKNEYDNEKNKVKEDHETNNKTFAYFLTNSKNNISILEKTYKDLLAIKEPTTHWNELKNKYENEGNKWKLYSIIISTVFIVIMCILLYNLPNWDEKKFELVHFQGLIIFSVIVSVFSYLIHLFVKLSTSAFHLSRDAEERRQLTYIYLSLLKEGKIDPKEREIVLQSLFCRADTGLLKNDNSPTLSAIGNMFKNNINK
jgi:hypothetical protein